MENNNEVKYAGFWVRLLAFIVDILVVSFFISVMSKIGSMEKLPIVAVLILWLYFAISLNRWGTTIGGKFLGIRIYTEEMNNLSFLKASVRFIVSIMPFVFYQYLKGMQHMMSPTPSPAVQMLPQLIFILLPFIMFFTKKRQMLHDIVVKSVIINVNEKVQVDETSPNKILYRGRMLIRIIGVILFLVVGGYILLYTSVFYMLGKQSSNSYNNSFHIKYQTNDFNDSRIIFYQKELEFYSKEFIEAEGMYDIFAADVKKDLALNCIEHFLREHNETDWIDQGSGFRKNARNKYASTEEKIEKAKKNEDYMGKHFYDYDLNDVNSLEDKIANMETCQKLLTIDTIYNIFIYKYIDNREWALADYSREWANASYFGTLNKSFYGNKQEKTQEWLDMLYNKYPRYKKDKKRQEIEDRIYVEKMEREKKKKKEVKLKKREEKLMENARKRGDLGALRMLEVQQIIGDRASIPHMGYRDKTGILKITIHGAECSDFKFPPKTQCESM